MARNPMPLLPSRYGWFCTSPKRVGRGEQRHVSAIRVAPLLLRPGQSRFENVLIPNSWRASVFAELVVVDGVNDHPGQPLGLGPTTPGHRLPRQLSKGAAVLLGSSCGDSQGPFGVRIVGCQKNPTICLHRQDAVAGLQRKRSAMSLSSVNWTDRSRLIVMSTLLSTLFPCASFFRSVWSIVLAGRSAGALERAAPARRQRLKPRISPSVSGRLRARPSTDDRIEVSTTAMTGSACSGGTGLPPVPCRPSRRRS